MREDQDHLSNGFVKNDHIAGRVFFLDGFSGSGKSVLGPVLSSFENIEKTRIEYSYEYLSTLDHFNKIDRSAAVTLLRLYADNALYDSTISRGVNLRMQDETGLLNNPFPIRDIARLFQPGGDAPMAFIRQMNPALQVMTHHVLPCLQLPILAFGERFRMVEMVRHPLYLIDHWYSYIGRYGTDPRELSLCFDHHGQVVPWFAVEWADKFIAAAPADRVIFAIQWLTQKSAEQLERLTLQEKQRIMFVPFEKFVKEPWPVVEAMEGFLGTQRTRATAAMLKKQKCPRTSLSAGKGYKHYGWSDNRLGDMADFDRRLKFVEEKAGKEALGALMKMCSSYEEKYAVRIKG